MTVNAKFQEYFETDPLMLGTAPAGVLIEFIGVASRVGSLEQLR